MEFILEHYGIIFIGISFIVICSLLFYLLYCIPVFFISKLLFYVCYKKNLNKTSKLLVTSFEICFVLSFFIIAFLFLLNKLILSTVIIYALFIPLILLLLIGYWYGYFLLVKPTIMEYNGLNKFKGVFIVYTISTLLPYSLIFITILTIVIKYYKR